MDLFRPSLGFYYQSLFALFALLQSEHDDASVSLERLDDVELISTGASLLSQLKHSMASAPASVTVTSPNLWRTFKAWIDILDKVVIEQTTFQLVTVASIPQSSRLIALTDPEMSRDLLHDDLLDEARRVVEEHESAKKAGEIPLPHADRVKSCQAFLDLDDDKRRDLLRRTLVRPGSTNIAGMPDLIAGQLRNFPPPQRAKVAERLIEWWDLQVIFTLCGKRERFIGAVEVQQKTSELAGEIEREELTADFVVATQPKGYKPDSMLIRQIELVRGTESDLNIAVREEWRARSQRHKWASDRLDMVARIELYDKILEENWSDKHQRMQEDCRAQSEEGKCDRGHVLLRWSLEDAHKEVPEFAPKWASTYYVRGTYQILAINLQVGWHPEFRYKLGGGE